MGERTYIAIDLKSFYASVECRERDLDPLTTHLVVADKSRTDKTICLAVTPSLKAYGISGRSRLFEVVQRVREVNSQRRRAAPNRRFTGSSSDAAELANHPEWELDYIVAPPRMALYMKRSTEIYRIYLKYIAPEDIHVYSIDEVFMDVTHYLPLYHVTPRELTATIIRDVLNTTGITATAGIGSNLYLAKVAMDVVAKHVQADKDGVRIAELTEMTYREKLWDHVPLTDFWRVGPGYARKLEQRHLHTMGDVARCSTTNEALLYELFGVNAELLIDHAWGWEPTTIADIKAYRPENSGIGSGQVLTSPYTTPKARVVVREMAELLALDLVDKGLATEQLTLTVGYDRESLNKADYSGPITTDGYGRAVPKHSHGTIHLKQHTSSGKEIVEAMLSLYDRIIQPDLLVRRLNLTADKVVSEWYATGAPRQLDLFSTVKDLDEADSRRSRENRRQKAILQVKARYGKNAILTGTNFEKGATAQERNRQIGGHRA